MSQDSLETYAKLLNKYRIAPDYIEELGKVKKIYTKQGIFALKQAKFSSEQRSQFIHAVQNLHEKGYRHVLPIYLTAEGKYLISEGDNDYYVMPWIDSNRSLIGNHYEDLIKEAARLHTVTEVKGKVNLSYLQHFFEKSSANIDKRKLDYERFIEKCEKKVYMSPFELLFCTYFIQIIRMEDSALRQLDDWFYTVKEKKQDRVSICHGNLSPNHLVYDENGRCYFINFERTYTASPIYDLHYFFRKLLFRYPQKVHEAGPLFIKYIRNNQLTEDERLLFYYYMLQTEKIHTIIKQYQTASSVSERNMVVKLQRSIWQMQAAHTFVTQATEAIQQEIYSTMEEAPETPAEGLTP